MSSLKRYIIFACVPLYCMPDLNGDKQWLFWQKSIMKIPGIEKPVDVDVFKGTAKLLKNVNFQR